MLHVLTGESAGCSLRLALKSEEVLAFPDALSCGPAVAASISDVASFLSGRQRFWADVVGESASSLERPELAAALSRACKAPAVTLWHAASAQEQLFLAFFCALVESAGTTPRLLLVRVDAVPNRVGNLVRVRSLGILDDHELALAPAPIELSCAEVHSLANIWLAWASPDPAHFLQAVRAHEDLSETCWTGLHALVDRYPDQQRGLNAWDLALLVNVRARGPQLLRVIGYTLGESETDDLVGSGWLFWRSRCLASGPRPLIRFDAESSNMRDCTVSISEWGIAVLEGRANALTLNGIDDWVGGVHLDVAAGRVWVRSDGALVPWSPAG